MVGRPTKILVLEMIYKYVSEHPGCRPSHAAQGVGLDPRNFDSRLASMPRVGLLLSEDGRGRLFPHSRHGVLSTWLLEYGNAL